MAGPGRSMQETFRTLTARRCMRLLPIASDSALVSAQEVDAKISRGEDPGLLAGVPFSVKDIFCTKGIPSTAASRILANFVPPYTATSVEKMSNAGAVVLGKVNLDEFTFRFFNRIFCLQTDHPQSMGYFPRSGWIFRRKHGSSGCRGRSAFPGDGYSRLHSPAGGFLWRGGCKANLWSCFAVRSDRIRILTGLPRVRSQRISPMQRRCCR